MVKRRLLLLLLSLLSTSCCCYCTMPTSSRTNRWGPLLPTTTALQGVSSSSSSSSAAATTSTEAAPSSSTASSAAAATTSSVTTRDVLSLESIRHSLIRQEETIIFALIERAQFRQNPIVYQKGGFGDLGLPVGCSEHVQKEEEASLSFLEYMLLGTEVLHCRVRRYTSPEEHAFFPEYLTGPLSALKQLDYPQEVLLSSAGMANQINFNPLLLQYYIQSVVPSLSVQGDDEQHGSTVLCDIAALQALSRRIHYGKFVAESKYQSNPQAYQQLIDQNDDAAVMALLTDPVVERKVLLRARLKATTYGREPLVLSNLLSKDIMDSYHDKHSSTSAASSAGHVVVEEDTDDLTTLIAATAAASAVVAALDALQQQQQPNHSVNGNADDNNAGETSRARSSTSSSLQALRPKVDPRVIESIYRDIIIPLTKDVEVAYLFRRCGREPPARYNVVERMKLLQQ